MADPSAVAASPDPSATLDLGSVEADLADPGVVGLRKLGTVGTGPLCRLVAAVPALVAEVRRLRGELERHKAPTGDAEIDALLAKCKRNAGSKGYRVAAYALRSLAAARAEAERLRDACWANAEASAERDAAVAEAARVRDMARQFVELHFGPANLARLDRRLDAALDGAE